MIGIGKCLFVQSQNHSDTSVPCDISRLIEGYAQFELPILREEDSAISVLPVLQKGLVNCCLIICAFHSSMFVCRSDGSDGRLLIFVEGCVSCGTVKYHWEKNDGLVDTISNIIEKFIVTKDQKEDPILFWLQPNKEIKESLEADESIVYPFEQPQRECGFVFRDNAPLYVKLRTEITAWLEDLVGFHREKFFLRLLVFHPWIRERRVLVFDLNELRFALLTSQEEHR
ncbi:hypothetical protein Tco_1143899 [Tanacetum coccineum]